MSKRILTLAFMIPILYTACTDKETNISVAEAPLPTTPTTLAPKETTVNYANTNSTIKKQGMMHISSFMETLKPTLKELMQKDPTHKVAMGGCSAMAQSMTSSYNAVAKEASVRRTALKYRNEINKPDATDTLVMERFLASQNFKEPLVVEMPNHYRVYKALAIKPVCLACHGTNISKDLQTMLHDKYPTDMATGFKLGEFRGVVVAELKK